VWRWLATYCWKALEKGYNFSWDLTSIGGLHIKLWDSKIEGVPILGISRLPLGSPRTKWHLSANLVARHKKYYKGGRWWFPPSLSHGESCESMFARGSSMHKKCSNYVLTNLLFGLCKSVWVIDLLVNLPSPHYGTPTCPFTLEMLWAEECAQLCHLPLFSPLDSQLSPSCSFEVRHSCCYL